MRLFLEANGKKILEALPFGAANRMALRMDRARITVVNILNGEPNHAPAEETVNRLVEEIIVEIDAIDKFYETRQAFKKAVEKELMAA